MMALPNSVWGYITIEMMDVMVLDSISEGSK